MHFRERLTVPVAWWVLAALFAVSLLAAIGFYLGPAWGIGVGVLSMGVAALVFTTTAVVVAVDDTELRVGRAVIERSYLASVEVLDRAATDRRAGVEADARAHLVLKPYVATSVAIVLDDPDDPVPYWLVSTRHPARLAAALVTSAGTGSGTESPAGAGAGSPA
ncbi:DUF3093 domain-containing protein [uncultured Friedmanniella sp.]|uniref:DUF3093 domain-containing protein n=1 Tax=uncultured Friedmanniella sp. TaxID=335381 RepID=UPI0035CB06AD